ncbi:MAG: xanthine dehydrogenase accessory protein XdhC [Deinococcota bacterium]
MKWLEHSTRLATTQTPFVTVTIISVRGHAPRRAGSKMLVTSAQTLGSVGGGNLEQTAINRARDLLSTHQQNPELMTVRLNPKGGDYGIQCCGGEVQVLLEPHDPRRPCVVIFGAGHVGWALVHVLGTLPVDVKLVDSRQAQLTPAETTAIPTNLQTVHVPIPETALDNVPDGAYLLVLTHDHAEDLAILERALQCPDFPYVGLIGSKTKWQHFQQRLKETGLSEADLARVTTPIGLSNVPGKSPQAIAIGVAAQLLGLMHLPDSHF